MLKLLPTALEVGGKSYAIRTDYRVILNIYQAFGDDELSDSEKCYVCLKCLYVDFEKIPQALMQEAINKAYWFVGGGDIPKADVQFRTMDWEKDESIIFPAISKAAGYEVRSVPYLHWWVVVGLFNEIGEGLFSQVISIRSKIARGKKLEKYEREFYRFHRNLIDLDRLSGEKEREDEELIRHITGEK